MGGTRGVYVSHRDIRNRCRIQGDSEGKANILGGDGSGHCKKNNGYRHRTFLNLQIQMHCEW